MTGTAVAPVLRPPAGRQRIIWDNHACMPLRADPTFLPQLERLRHAGFSMVSLNVGMDHTPAEDILRVMRYFRDWIAEHPADYLLAGSTEDIAQAAGSGRLAVAFDLEGAGSLAHRPELLSVYADLGIRWIGLAYNRNNGIGGGCHDDDQGLTALGKSLVRSIQAAGVVVCLSHCGWRTARDVLEEAGSPVIFSHSNPHALAKHGRNIPDELIRSCAKSGGVVGINGVDLFLGSAATADRIAHHVAYVADLVGSDHVGLSLDYVFDQEELRAYLRAHKDRWSPSLGYHEDIRIAPPECLPFIVDALRAKGFSELEVDGILGRNWLRVAGVCWSG